MILILLFNLLLLNKFCFGATVLNAVAYSIYDEGQIFTPIINDFNKYSENNNLNITINLNLLTTLNSTYSGIDFGSLIETLNKKKSTKYDFYFYDSLYSENYGSHFLDLKKWIPQEYIDNYDPSTLKQTCMYNDKLIGFPVTLDYMVLYSDEKLLKKYNKTIPLTWDELLETSKYILDHEKKENNTELIAYNGLFSNDDHGTFSTYEYIYSYRDSKDSPFPDITSQNAIDALEMMKKMKQEIASDYIFNANSYSTINNLMHYGSALFLKFWILAEPLLNFWFISISGSFIMLISFFTEIGHVTNFKCHLRPLLISYGISLNFLPILHKLVLILPLHNNSLLKYIRNHKYIFLLFFLVLETMINSIYLTLSYDIKNTINNKKFFQKCKWKNFQSILLYSLLIPFMKLIFISILLLLIFTEWNIKKYCMEIKFIVIAIYIDILFSVILFIVDLISINNYIFDFIIRQYSILIISISNYLFLYDYKIIIALLYKDKYCSYYTDNNNTEEINVKSLTLNAVAFHFDGNTLIYSSLVDDFNQYSKENNLDISIKLNLLTSLNSTNSFTDFGSMIEALLKKKTNKYDLYFYDSVYISKYYDHLLDLYDLIPEEHLIKFDPNIVSKFSIYKNKLVGLPYTVIYTALYSNKALLKKYNRRIPKTWEELMETSKYIMDEEKNLNNTELMTYNGLFSDDDLGTYNINQFIYSYRESVESPFPDFTSENAVNALKMIKKLKEEIASESLEKVDHLTRFYNISIHPKESTLGFSFFILLSLTIIIMLISIIFLYLESFCAFFKFLSISNWILTIIGSIFIILSCFTKYGEVNVTKCCLKILFLSFGFTFTYIPILYKLIINFPEKNQISSWIKKHKYIYISFFIIMDIILNSILFINPYSVKNILNDNGHYHICKMENVSTVLIIISIFCFKFSIIIIMLMLIFFEWNIKSTHYDIRFIVSSIYMDSIGVIVLFLFSSIDIGEYKLEFILHICILLIISLTNYIFIYCSRILFGLLNLKNVKVDIIKNINEISYALELNVLGYTLYEDSQVFSPMVNDFNNYSSKNNLNITINLNMLTNQNSTFDLSDYGSMVETLLKKKSKKYDFIIYDIIYTPKFAPYFLNLYNNIEKEHLDVYDKNILTQSSVYNNRLVGLVNNNFF
ncbi:periplasmic binding protein-like II [Anaeromyces robustus]|uniref:Periplasmic binding protein-like II n=1 Tax=Anaeromyces robustus TaxID=1754192 RepID=A0A1Y1XBR5_9FUNG|nr:periplasmic binding protein-like II [Anaeromyces robustus]|eukprot:ORX83189.1 periplasmic binding protein-like II [Anaeromyces robustus]